MTALPDWNIVTDAELACAAAAGDRNALGGIYDRYADRLHDFCVGMLGDRDAAADCVQDVFCHAATILPQLREPDKLRPWLYSIARHAALRRIHHRRREQVVEELPDETSGEPGPESLAARTELAELIAAAAGALSDRDRTLLQLAYHHGLDGPEIADAMGVSHASANKMVQRLRDTVERTLGALLVARAQHGTQKPDGCPELAAILDGWDGQFTMLIRKRIARHIESCSRCEQERRRLVNPAALLGAVPVFIPAPAWLREHTLRRVQLTSASSGLLGAQDADAPNQARSTVHGDDKEAAPNGDDTDSDGRRSRRLLLIVALSIGIPLAASGLTIAWWFERGTAVSPIDVTRTAPAGTDRSTPGLGPTPLNSPAASTPDGVVSTIPAVLTAAPQAPATPIITHQTTLPFTAQPPPPIRPAPLSPPVRPLVPLTQQTQQPPPVQPSPPPPSPPPSSPSYRQQLTLVQLPPSSPPPPR